MEQKDTGGAAFPHKPEVRRQVGQNLHAVTPGDEPGMTLRDYFAMHAPAEPPHWFRPKMRAKPDSKYVDEEGNEYPNAYAAEKAVGEHFRDANQESRDDWEKDFLIERIAQWPWFWADIQLEARKH